MGEENYYETPPNEVTYFLDIFAVADQEYRDYYVTSGDNENYKREINDSVDGASIYFMKQFNIKLKVVEISDKVWNSDDATDNQSLGELLKDARNEFMWENNKRNADAMIAFTGKDPDYEGLKLSDSVAVQIPELSDPRVIEFWEPLQYFGIILDDNVQKEWSPRLTQHEVSHLFGAYDYGLENPAYHKQDNVTGKRLASIHSVMDKTKPTEDFWNFILDWDGSILTCNEWNEESIQIINSKKIEVTNGSYKKSV